MNHNNSGIVFNIQNFSVHDGAGIRTTVFFKGCPLRCEWCSNPESLLMKPQLAYNPGKCLGTEKCTRCIQVCPQDAIHGTGNKTIAFDSEMCLDCHTCAKNCAASALNVYGRQMIVGEVLQEVEKEGAFFTRSGGGMTLSGGEPLFQPKFAIALLQEAKRRHVRTAMETCGYVLWEDLQAACGCLDELIFDLKVFADEKHKKGTGVSNRRILENLAQVAKNFPQLPILVRTPVIPGFNDDVSEIRDIIDSIPVASNVRYELLPYHRMGQPKYAYLGREYRLDGQTLDQGVMQTLRALEREANEKLAGLEPVI
ncbi:(2S)-3-sulfopropanediol dehydratase activating enzyme [Desulfonatronum thioautotrophicum]|uniref:(2S)-3-sulfopropanediol dehydratase activating enzyme n=1 Tax=Desulfonatronum thioautotrophicum TaxID=617001 RepID=UPI0005EBDA70|nr:glycyl-radical enzyme activating protein [Desulfonatronum thioautotrophicum]